MASNSTTTNKHAIEDYSTHRNTSFMAVNVGQTERIVSALGGGALAIYGLTRFDRLGTALALAGSSLLFRGITGHSFIYQIFDIGTMDKESPTLSEIPGKKGVRVQRSLTINRSAQELYDFWRDVEKSPLYMDNIQSVLRTGERTSHWIATGPLGKQVEWNSEIIQEEPGKMIAWHVHGKPTTANAGKVSFTPATGNRGTIVTLELFYFRFGGPLGSSIGKVFAHLPEHEALENLRRFKELIETGEIISVKGQPTGQGRKK